MAYWWVNQGETYEASRDLGVLWAPVTNSSGRALTHWDRLTEMVAGDTVLHYAGGAVRASSSVTAAARPWTKPASFPGTWDDEGRMVRSSYTELAAPLPLASIPVPLRAAQGEGGPFDKNENVKQGYLWRISGDLSALVAGEAGGVAPDVQGEARGGRFTGLLDKPATAPRRGEQASLRKFLLGTGSTAECGLCGELLPVSYLRAAHIKPRSKCSDEERRDFAHIAMPACLFGCDALFEFGAIAVGESGLVEAVGVLEDASGTHRARLVGRRCKAFSEGSAGYFRWHRDTALAGALGDDARDALLLS